MANIIIMNLSKLKDSATKENYESDLGPIEGTNTADAPLQYLIKFIKSEGKSVDRILTVVTSEAKSAFKALKNMLKEFDPDLPEPVYIDGENDIDTVNGIIKHVEKSDRIYIESTGGLRNTTYTLMTIVKLLEYSGVTLEKAVYSNYNTGKGVPNSIEDITETYRMFSLINAANSFTSYGDASELERFFNNTDNEIIKETITAMKNFSDDITLCKTSGLDSELEQLNMCLSKLNDAENSTSRKEEALFSSLAEMIRKKFYMDKNSMKIEYPSIVRWCLENKLIQQAVTIYAEKMPKYFYDKKFFTVNASTLEKMKEQNSKSHFELEYELFYSGFMCEKRLPESTLMFRTILEKKIIDEKDNTPFRKRTVEEEFVRHLNESDNITVFTQKLNKEIKSKYNTDIMKKDLIRFFKIRRCIYNEDGFKRLPEEITSNLKEYPEVLELTGSNLGKKAEQFTNAITSNKKLLLAVAGIPADKYNDDHLNFLTRNTIGAENGSYPLNSGITSDEARPVLMDIYYTKTFIRNRLNHAGEDEAAAELTDFFSAFPEYNTDNELSVDYITALISNAMDRIENLNLS